MTIYTRLTYIQPTSCSECAMAVRARVELLVMAQTSTLTYSCTLGVQITNQELIGRLILVAWKIVAGYNGENDCYTSIMAHVIIIS